MIVPCKCKNEYQDKTHGKGNRVYNKGKKASESIETFPDGKTKKSHHKHGRSDALFALMK